MPGVLRWTEPSTPNGDVSDYELKITNCELPSDLPPGLGERGDEPVIRNSQFAIRNSQFAMGGREGGYTLVIIVLTIAIMSIFMAVAVQTVEFQMRREREAELIFRGEQYVEAIRLYKAKYGRHPMRMKEIWEADPKVVRKQWLDPITDSEDWGLIFLGQEGRRIGPENAFQGTPGATETVTFRGTQPGLGSDSPFGNRNREGEMIGPIVGVHSKSCEESIKIYEGRNTYCEWQFVLREKGLGRGSTNLRVERVDRADRVERVDRAVMDGPDRADRVDRVDRAGRRTRRHRAIPRRTITPTHPIRNSKFGIRKPPPIRNNLGLYSRCSLLPDLCYTPRA